MELNFFNQEQFSVLFISAYYLFKLLAIKKNINYVDR